MTLLQAGTFISREAYISIDSNDDVIALHSYSSLQSDISVCHVVKVSSDMAGVVWDSVIENIEGESSCMPSGIKADCEDGVYVTGFMASNKGFVRSGYTTSNRKSDVIQGVPHYCFHFVFVIFSGSRAHTEELFIAIG